MPLACLPGKISVVKSIFIDPFFPQDISLGEGTKKEIASRGNLLFCYRIDFFFIESDSCAIESIS